MDERCKNWKPAQDQPQFSNPSNRCLHCAGDHRSRDCSMRHQHQAPPTNNPVGSTGINSQYSPHFSQPSPPQHSQQSQSTAGSSTPMLMINNPQQFQQGHQRLTTPLVQQQVNQQVRPPQPFNPEFNQYTPPHASPLFAPSQFNPQYPPPYPGQLPQHPPSVHSNITETSELITQVLDRQFKLYQDREDACKEHKRWKEEREKKFRDDNNNRNRINKAFKKVNRFDGSNPDQCLPWMEEIFAMACNHKRNAREELLYNSGESIQETLYSLSPEATEDKIHDLLLQNHSNL